MRIYWRDRGCLSEATENVGLGAPDFPETLKYPARYDAITEQHLTNPGSRVTYLSHHSQNEFISGLASETLSTINEYVKAARHFSVIVDSTIDISNTDQMSLSLRYVDGAGAPMERFIKLAELPDGSAVIF